MCIEGAESSDDFRLCFPYFQEIHEFRGNSVYILFISSKWLGVFELNFGTLNEGSIEIFLNPYLRMSICNYLSIQSIYKFLDMVSVEYFPVLWIPLKNGYYRWCHKCGYTAFPANTFWCATFTWNVNLYAHHSLI